MPKGKKERSPERRELTELFCRKAEPSDRVRISWDTKQPGLGFVIQPSGYRSWRVPYRHQGRLRWYTVGAYPKIGLKDARVAASTILAKAAVGEDPHGEKVAARKAETFNQIADDFLRELGKQNKSADQTAYLIKKYLRPELGGRKARDIKRADVKRIIRKISEDRPVLGNQVLAACSMLFSWSVKEEILEANPCFGVERNKVRERERVLTEEEIRRLWPAFDKAGLVGSSILKLMLLTAQRVGEVRSMRWQDIEGRWWTIPAEVTKNKKTHRVYLSDAALQILGEFEPASRGYAFPAPTNEDRPISAPRAATVTRDAEVSDFRPHDLRRTAASYMTGMGIARLTVSKILNHQEGGITKVYDRHSYDNEKQQAMEAWAARLDEILSGTAHDSNVVNLSR